MNRDTVGSSLILPLFQTSQTSLMDFALLLLLSAWIVVLLPQLRRNVWAILVVGTQQLLALNGVSINQVRILHNT